jgi:pyrroline-5-carboxylate reductase
MTVAIIGAGVMGETLLSGLLRGGHDAADLMVGEKREERAVELRAKYAVNVVSDLAAVATADTVALVVKPQDMGDVLAEIAPHLHPGQLLISLAAGITTAYIEKHIPDGIAVVRVMPNTPALVDEGMSVLSAGAHAAEADLDEAEALLAAVGKVRRVPESQQDAVTALSGSGPAYFFFLVEAMIDAGILLGLPRTVAADLIVQSAFGAATMLRESTDHPVILREAVTSPAGTTIAAIRELERHGVRAALIAAIEAAHDRSVELGRAAQQR